MKLKTFLDSKISRSVASLVALQYPVIAVDSFLPVINPLTGKNMAEVKILLAMGTQEQVMSLQTLKVVATVTQLERRQATEHPPIQYVLTFV